MKRLLRPAVLVPLVAIVIVVIVYYTFLSKFLLHRAVLAGNVAIARGVIALDPRVVHQGDLYGDRPLARAVERGNVEMIRLLIEAGSDIDHEGVRIGSPAQYAAYHGDVEEVRLFVEAGYEIDRQPRHEIRRGTLLHLACRRGNWETVRYLVHKGADVNAISARGNMTPLMEAVSSSKAAVPGPMDRVKIVKLLLKQGADPHAKSASGYTALDYLQRKFPKLPTRPSTPRGSISVDKYWDAYLPLKEIEKILLERQREARNET